MAQELLKCHKLTIKSRRERNFGDLKLGCLAMNEHADSDQYSIDVSKTGFLAFAIAVTTAVALIVLLVAIL